MQSKARVSLLVAFTGATLAVRADEPPTPKPGLWEISTTIADSKRPPKNMKVCIGRDTVALLTQIDGNEGRRNNCAKATVQVEGARVTADASCKFESSLVSTHTVVTYQGSTAFHAESQARYEPPLFGKRDGQTTRDAKWLGECAAGMRAGDVTMDNGMKMNLIDLAGAAK